MDLKTKIQNSSLIRPDLKERLLASLDKLTDEQKSQIEESLDVKAFYEEAAEEMKRIGKRFEKEIKKDVEDNESKSAEIFLDDAMRNI